jgi:hypothetical protein
MTDGHRSHNSAPPMAEFRHVDVVFGKQSAQALTLLDAGKTRQEILDATGAVLVGDSNCDVWEVPAGGAPAPSKHSATICSNSRWYLMTASSSSRTSPASKKISMRRVTSCRRVCSSWLRALCAPCLLSSSK